MKKSKWWDKSWLPITGCTPVSDGCINCWAKRRVGKFPQIHSQSDIFNSLNIFPDVSPFEQINFHPNRLNIPFHWRKPKKIFVCSMGDLFHERVTDRQINEVWSIAFNNPRHAFMFLTKRPKRLMEWTKEAALIKMWPINEIWPEWMWLGVTAENQEMADKRIQILLQIPAAKRFVSVEPMLEPVDLRISLDISMVHGVDVPPLDWIICGKEIGPGARPMNLDWARSLRDQCVAADVPFFYKPGKLDGETWHQWPIGRG